MLKNFFLIFMLILVLVLGTTSGIFGYLYFAKSKDYTDLLNRFADSKEIIGEDSSTTETSVTTNVTFQDTPLEVKFEYPTSWKLVLGTNVSEDFAYEPVYGRILQNYKATLTKGTSVLTFEKILGAIDGFPTLVDKSTVDFQEVDSDLIRYKLPAESKWKYVQWMSCSEFTEMFGTPTASEVCLSQFYPGFGKWANIAYISASNAEDLAEADLIVKSALN